MQKFRYPKAVVSAMYAGDHFRVERFCRGAERTQRICNAAAFAMPQLRCGNPPLYEGTSESICKSVLAIYSEVPKIFIEIVSKYTENS